MLGKRRKVFLQDAFLNGLALLAVELKNEISVENVLHGMRQCKDARDPKESIAEFFPTSTSYIAAIVGVDGVREFDHEGANELRSGWRGFLSQPKVISAKFSDLMRSGN